MAVISWGKPNILIGPSGELPAANASAATFEMLPTPVEDSTNLTANEGDKTEATIEGGEAEATKFKAATFEFTMNVRMAKNRRLPTKLKNSETGGYTADNVAILLQPEAHDAPGIFIASASVSVVESYTSADGAMWEFKFAPVVNDNKPAVRWGVITLPDASTAGTSPNTYDTYGIKTTNFTPMLKFNGESAS